MYHSSELRRGGEGYSEIKGKKEAVERLYERHDFPLNFKGFLTLKHFCDFMCLATKILLSR
jgi:hypothetical protein